MTSLNLRSFDPNDQYSHQLPRWPLNGPMATPCFAALPRTGAPISSPANVASLASSQLPSQGQSIQKSSGSLAVPAATLLALGSRKLQRRKAKVQRQVIGPAVAAAAAAAKVAAAGKLAAAGGAAASVAAGIKTLSKERPTQHKSGKRPKMVVLGTGWGSERVRRCCHSYAPAGWGSVTFLQGLSEDVAKFYDITVVAWLHRSESLGHAHLGIGVLRSHHEISS